MSEKVSPAFQFYASDFVGGTMSFSSEQVGAYILLLCYQWMNGSIPSDDTELCQLGRCSSTALAVVKRKFKIVLPDGNLQNSILEDVRAEQIQYRTKQAENGKKGGLSSKHRSSTAQAPLPATLKPESSSPSPSPSTLSQEAHFPEAEIPSWEEFWEYCQSAGLHGESFAKDKFLLAEQGNWQGKPNWRKYADRVKGWWEEAGRPMDSGGEKPAATNGSPKPLKFLKHWDVNNGPKEAQFKDRVTGIVNEGSYRSHLKAWEEWVVTQTLGGGK